MEAATGVASNPGATMAAATAISTRRLVSLTEAAEILGLSTKTIRRYIAAGDLDAVRLGRRVIRIKAESIERLIGAHPLNATRRGA
jgi:excisionase family DNA binding protein